MSRLEILAILGSPRCAGNTETLLDAALAAAAESGAGVEKVSLSRLRLEGCRECGGCESAGECVVADDMQDLYPKLRRADRVIIGSPVFFAGVTAQTKTMFDRCQAQWVRKYRLKERTSAGSTGRLGAVISVSGMPDPRLFRGLVAEARAFFASNDLRFVGGIFFPGIDHRGEEGERPEAIHEARALGRFLADADRPPRSLTKTPWSRRTGAGDKGGARV